MGSLFPATPLYKIAALFLAAILAVAAHAKGYMFDPENPPGLLAMDPAGNFYVRMGNWSGIEKCTPKGKDLGKFAEKMVTTPSYLVFGKSGDAYAAEFDKVEKVSATGRKLLEIKRTRYPYALAVDSHGCLYVSYLEAEAGDIDRFDSSGKVPSAFLSLFPSVDTKGSLLMPLAIFTWSNLATGASKKSLPKGMTSVSSRALT